jgi:hypothetical protein
MESDMVEVNVTSTRNGVYIYFPVDYAQQLFGNTIPKVITLLCGGHTVRARFNAITSSAVRYRVYNQYIHVLLSHDECRLVVEEKV